MAASKADELNSRDRLIWLDPNVDSPASKSKVKQFREIDPKLMLFSSPDQCMNYVLDENERRSHTFIIITSGQFGKEFIPLAHDCPCVLAFFIYCMQPENYRNLQFEKIQRICNDILDLLHAVSFFILRTNEQINMNFFQADQSNRAGTENSSETESAMQRRVKITLSRRDCAISEENILFLHLEPSAANQANYPEHPVRNVVDDQLHFIWYNQFFASMTDLSDEDAPRAKAEMVAKWTSHAQNDSTYQYDIEEFKRESLKDNARNAIRWYTLNSCFYRFVNQAFRTENIPEIYANRYLIRLICLQLRSEHKEYTTRYRQTSSSRTLRLYRGQKLKQCHIDSIRKRTNQLMTFNGFVSTTVDEEVAKVCTNRHSIENTQKVLFRIDVDMSEHQSAIFADVSVLSRYPQEKEVLLAVGMTYRVKSVKYDSNEGFYRVHLSLSQTDEVVVSDYIKQTYPSDGNNFNRSLLFGKLLFEMNQCQLAVDYLTSIRRCLPKSNSNIQALYFNNLGVCYVGMGDLASAKESYEQALSANQKTNNAQGLGSSYHNVSNSWK